MVHVNESQLQLLSYKLFTNILHILIIKQPFPSFRSPCKKQIACKVRKTPDSKSRIKTFIVNFKVKVNSRRIRQKKSPEEYGGKSFRKNTVENVSGRIRWKKSPEEYGGKSLRKNTTEKVSGRIRRKKVSVCVLPPSQQTVLTPCCCHALLALQG